MKRIAAVIIIVLILILGDRVGAYIISSLFLFSNDNIAKVYSKNVSEKIVILGNSRAFRHFDDNFMEKKFGKKVINLSEPGHATVISEALLKDFTELNGKPRLVIFEATSTLNDFESILSLRPFQSISHRIEKLIKENHYDIFLWSKISHLYRYNNRKTLNILHKVFTENKNKIFEGTIINSEQIQKTTNFNETRHKNVYFYQNLKALEEIVQHCKKNKIDLRILISPVFPNNKFYQDEIEFIKLNLPGEYTWDLSKIKNLSEKDFYDTGHLNKKGVEKFMLALEEKKFF